MLGVAELIMGVYPRLIDFFLGEKDVIEKTLFYAGYDWAFWLVAIILITILGIFMVCLKKKTVMLAAPVAVTSSMPFIMMMVVGLGGLCAGLSILSTKMKKAPVMILFILSFVCAMAMGYMSSQDSTQSWVNWVEQSINTVSQLCLMLGVIVLHKKGLKDWTWEGASV